jgi:hypothetical protein
MLDGQVPCIYAVARGRDDLIVLVEVEAFDAHRFTLRADRYDFGTRDIYGDELNLWRMPVPANPSDEELRRRILSMVRFLDAYFSTANIRSLASVDVSALPIPFILASGGVALRRERDLPPRFLALFDSREDALRARALIVPFFDGVITPITPHRFERWALIFRQMAQALDQAETG